MVGKVLPGVVVLLLGKASWIEAGLQTEDDEVLRASITNGAVITVNRPCGSRCPVRWCSLSNSLRVSAAFVSGQSSAPASRDAECKLNQLLSK